MSAEGSLHGSPVARFDARVEVAAARLPRSLSPLMWVATALGYPAVQAIPLGVVGFLNDGALRAAPWALALLMTVPTIIKRSVHRKRPSSHYVDSMKIPSASFPSGHAYASVAAAGYAAFIAITRLDLGLATLITTLGVLWIVWVSTSRLFFRAHYGTDVVGGWLIAGVVLTGVLAVTQP